MPYLTSENCLSTPIYLAPPINKHFRVTIPSFLLMTVNFHKLPTTKNNDMQNPGEDIREGQEM